MRFHTIGTLISLIVPPMLSWFTSLFGAKNTDSSLDFALQDQDIPTLKALDSKIVIGKVLEVKAHPDPKITKVQITRCDLGNGTTEQILCGGTNVSEGIIVPVATVGAKLSKDFQIGERDIRGEVSRGMICARSELNISANGEQKGEIWILPEAAKAHLGTALNTLV